jgi:hypothetical protein
MRRTQIYLGEDQKDALSKLSQTRGVPMAELVREAIDAYLVWASGQEVKDALARCFGIWKDRTDITDSDAYVRDLRRTWRNRVASLYEAEPARDDAKGNKRREAEEKM